jgi:hypothetical protein
VPRRNPIVDRTYRYDPGSVNYWKEVAYYIGGYVVIYLPHTGSWKRAWLCGLLPHRDQFVIRWRKHGRVHVKVGIWRVHKLSLFALEREGGRLLPTPLYRDKLLVQSNNTKRDEGSTRVATTKKETAKSGASTNGGTPARTVNDKLEGLSEVKRRNIAKFITKERGKSPATAWPDVISAVKTKYDWTLPGSMTGRRLMREYGPDNAESAIIKQERSATPKKRGSAKKADPNVEALAGLSRKELKELIAEEELEVKVLKRHTDDEIRQAIIEAGWSATADEEAEEEVEDEEPEDEADEEEDDDDEAEEEDEEEEPAPTPKKVAVKRGAAKPKPKAKPKAKAKPKPKANPSK